MFVKHYNFLLLFSKIHIWNISIYQHVVFPNQNNWPNREDEEFNLFFLSETTHYYSTYTAKHNLKWGITPITEQNGNTDLNCSVTHWWRHATTRGVAVLEKSFHFYLSLIHDRSKQRFVDTNSCSQFIPLSLLGIQWSSRSLEIIFHFYRSYSLFEEFVTPVVIFGWGPGMLTMIYTQTISIPWNECFLSVIWVRTWKKEKYWLYLKRMIHLFLSLVSAPHFFVLSCVVIAV